MNPKKDIVDINDKLIMLWTKNQNSRAKTLALKTYADRSLKKNIFFYIKNGLYFRKNNDRKIAFKFFKKPSLQFPDDELSSLCTYIELADLHKYKLAIKEMDRFLQNHKADSYKVTLVELLEGLEKGYSTDYEELIIKYSIENKINIKKYYPSWRK